MSLLPLHSEDKRKVWYGDPNREEQILLVGIPIEDHFIQVEVSEVVSTLFSGSAYFGGAHKFHEHPKTNPRLCPVKRFKRHRNGYVYQLNQFRHWWKTSRLLVRLSGGYEYCIDPVYWDNMASYVVSKRKHARKALKAMKKIGRGGMSRDFLNNVHPFTRSIRIILGVARAWEAQVDNRLCEVGISEALAFMGNRCSRWVARKLVDNTTKLISFPVTAWVIAPYLDQNSRPVIIIMGFIRAVLPFTFSFFGSAIGRKLTFSTYKYANYRWQPVQRMHQFHRDAGVYRDTIIDQELQELARRVAVAIGHGKDPSETRNKLASLGFYVVAAGCGGHAVFRIRKAETNKVYILYLTPYGPSILDEMPRYVVLERRRLIYARQFGYSDLSDASIMDASLAVDEVIHGFTYAGAFFKPQEWAALTVRFQQELESYSEACKRLGTIRSSIRGEHLHQNAPPCDLTSLKAFIRSGNFSRKMKRDNKRWKQIEAEVRKMSNLMVRFKKNGKAPKRVILYLEGLDCSGKSSTGGLICKALEQSGFDVNTAQHNRPPTPEQRKKPWMDRSRFEFPHDMYTNSESIPEYSAVVWDRGPAGDFVYGDMSELNLTEKLKKYEEFRTYDASCQEQGILFCKLLFVTSKDSIASTLGKRLAHKKIAQDLRTWLDANSLEHVREGLEEIELHIDPTDFVAFNKYEENLAKFTEFARNTDNVGHVGFQAHSTIGYVNPWTVVNTSKRHPARLELLRVFQEQLKQFTTLPQDKISAVDTLINFFKVNPVDEPMMPSVPTNYVEDNVHGISFRAVIQSILILLLVYFYAYITWEFDVLEYV